MLNNEVSVVIPTLGGGVLKETINKLKTVAGRVLNK